MPTQSAAHFPWKQRSPCKVAADFITLEARAQTLAISATDDATAASDEQSRPGPAIDSQIKDFPSNSISFEEFEGPRRSKINYFLFGKLHFSHIHPPVERSISQTPTGESRGDMHSPESALQLPTRECAAGLSTPRGSRDPPWPAIVKGIPLS